MVGLKLIKTPLGGNHPLVVVLYKEVVVGEVMARTAGVVKVRVDDPGAEGGYHWEVAISVAGRVIAQFGRWNALHEVRRDWQGVNNYLLCRPETGLGMFPECACCVRKFRVGAERRVFPDDPHPDTPYYWCKEHQRWIRWWSQTIWGPDGHESPVCEYRDSSGKVIQ